MQIQIWKRRTKDNTKYNLYLRYRINQNKAKVESMRLWEWINPSNKIQEEHNDSVKKASEEIIRRVKDDIENDRVSISFENRKKTYHRLNLPYHHIALVFPIFQPFVPFGLDSD